MEMKSLRDVFTHELKDMYSAEKQILKALPKIIKKAGSTELQEALEDHRMATENQVGRLEEILGAMEETAKTAKKCKGMAGILEEGEELLKERAMDGVLDAALIGAAQKVEHYEIAAYGTLVAFAKQLGEDRAVELLEETLEEEKTADETLTQIASSINDEANVES
jgi:ferritin-like metal-binding protein YciE